MASAWEFHEWQCFTGFVFGIVSGAICLTAILFLGIMKQVFARIKQRFDNIAPNLGTIACPVIGGLVVGMSTPCLLVYALY